MLLDKYPKLTVIMRGYSYEQAMLIIKVLSRYDYQVGVEVTTNNPDYLKIIKDGTTKFGDKVYIGVGTVLNIEQAKSAIGAGAQFMLGPQKFDKAIFALAKKEKIIIVPGAMTPTEVYDQLESGADIVKIFPAITTGPKIFSQIQGPLGPQKLMAVGGVNLENAKDFLKAGAGYLGIGSNFFNKADVESLDEQALTQSVDLFLERIS